MTILEIMKEIMKVKQAAIDGEINPLDAAMVIIELQDSLIFQLVNNKKQERKVA